MGSPSKATSSLASVFQEECAVQGDDHDGDGEDHDHGDADDNGYDDIDHDDDHGDAEPGNKIAWMCLLRSRSVYLSQLVFFFFAWLVV